MASNHMTPRMFLAKEIRRAREEIGAKTDDVAKAVYVSEGLVRSWEKGRRLPQPDHLLKVEELVGPAAMKGILGRIREDLVNAAVPLEWMGRWRVAERRATALLWFETIVMPGLLQTQEYAAAVFQMAKHLGDVEQMLAERLERQQILTGEDDEVPTLVVVISEAVLLNNVGGADVMRGQLAHLIEMAELDNVLLHVIPLMAGVGAGFLAHFIVATLNGGQVAYADNQLNGEVIEEPENIAILHRMFERFRANALSQPDSITLIRKVMEERWTTK